MIAETGGEQHDRGGADCVLGESMGTSTYMSPEQALGDPVDARSDVYSLGVALYQMLAGRVPYQDTTRFSLVRQMVHEPPIQLRTAAPRF